MPMQKLHVQKGKQCFVFRWKKSCVYSSKGTLTSLDDINCRILLENSMWKLRNWGPIPNTLRPEIPLRSPISPGRAKCRFNYLQRYLARLSLAVLICACCLSSLHSSSRVLPQCCCSCYCSCCWGRMVLVLTGGGWCALTVAASPSLLFFDWNERRLWPGVAIAGAAVVAGRAVEGVCAVASRWGAHRPRVVRGKASLLKSGISVA